jgi:hypothetical protein
MSAIPLGLPLPAPARRPHSILALPPVGGSIRLPLAPRGVSTELPLTPEGAIRQLTLNFRIQAQLTSARACSRSSDRTYVLSFPLHLASRGPSSTRVKQHEPEGSLKTLDHILQMQR